VTFATPLAFALFATTIPIIIFYILKIRLRRVPVSTNLFWKQIFDEKPPRSIWQYLRHLLSLLAQLLFVALLVCAIADPSLAWQLLQSRRLVLLIDNSASMRATDVTPSRFQAAISAAIAMADGLRFRDEMAIVLAGPEPEVVVGMSGHVPTLKRALRSIPVTDNPTELALAIELGKQLTGNHPHGQVHVFSDGCAPTIESLAKSNTAALQLHLFGNHQTGNIGITQFQVRRSLIDPIGYEVLVTVKNASTQAATGRLELELDGDPVDILPLDLKPDGVFTRALEKTSLDGGTLTATLTQIRVANGSDASANDQRSSDLQLNALATDDRAWAVLSPRKVQDVLIVTSGNVFLHKVFEANPLVRATIRKDFPAVWPSDTVIVLHRQVPEKLPAGNLYIVDPLNKCDAWDVGELISNPIITEQDSQSPLMTHVRLDNVVMPQARQLMLANSPHILAKAVNGDPIYCEVKGRPGKCLVLSVNLDEGDLAFRTAFPIMVTNALGWFAGQSAELREALATGSLTAVDVPDTEEPNARYQLRSPSEKLHLLTVRSRHASQNTQDTQKNSTADSNPDAKVGSAQLAESPATIASQTLTGAEAASQLPIPPLNECGLWTVTKKDANNHAEPFVALAVNLANERETDIRSPDTNATAARAALAAIVFTRPIWFYFAIAACLITVIEWSLYQRRVLT
jgi:hypothetical protein